MANTLKATFEFTAEPAGGSEPVKATVTWDSTTQQLTSTGTMYPWMVRAVMRFLEDTKDETKPPRPEQKAPEPPPQRSLRDAARKPPAPAG